MTPSRTFRSVTRHDAKGARRRTLVTGAVAATALALTACGGGGGGTESGAVGFDDAESAVVKIEAQGTFVEIDGAAREGDWWGSGLIVDPAGIVVTNNHVVVGAATLDVEVGGDTYNARILGTSECLDLAVIDIEGDGFSYFDWYEGEIRAAQEVWALGFPDVADRSYTVTRGIVSKADTGGDTPWASLDHTIEHDARIRGGNSGGPLVQEAGLVVGVNFAGDDVNDTNYAIHRDEVSRVFDDLAAGTNVLSLGINGQAWLAEDGSASGIFASSVASGSPADEAGIEPGDLVVKMEGVTLAQRGTMDEYCSVLRTHGIDATLAVEVYRPSDGGVYVGQVNGDPLEVASLPQTDPDDNGGGGGTSSGELTTVTDDEGVITVQIPTSWSDVDGRSFTDDLGNTVYDVTASTSISEFRAGWDVSGVTVSASQDALDDYTVDEILDAFGQTAESGSCTLRGGSRQPYSDALYTGSYDFWEGCGGVGTSYVVIGATADDGSHLIWVSIQTVSGDEAAIEAVVSSFMADFS